MPMVLWPALAGNHEGFAALIEAGADPEAPFRDDGVATELLVPMEDQRFLDTALASGADPNAIGSNAEPLVWKAFYADRWDVIQKLIAAGADVDAPNHGDPSHTLLSTYSNGAFDKVIWLLERGADPSHRIEAAPPGHEDRVGAQPILENVFYVEVDEARFPQGAADQERAQAMLLKKGYSRPPRPRRYGG
jgi:hypothetical protein